MSKTLCQEKPLLIPPNLLLFGINMLKVKTESNSLKRFDPTINVTANVSLLIFGKNIINIIILKICSKKLDITTKCILFSP